MTIPLFSVVVRVHRRPTKLAVALSSIESQTMKDYEIVCTVDDPTDSLSIETLKDFSAKLPIRLLRVPYFGWPKCNLYLNEAVTKCRGEWVTYLDDDDEIVSTKYFQTLSDTISSGNFAVILTRFLQGQRNSAFRLIPGESWNREIRRGDIGTPCIVVRRDVALRHRWEGTPTGDFSFIKSVYDEAVTTGRLRWLDVVGVRTQGTPSFGRTEY